MDNERVPFVACFYSKYSPFLSKTSFAKLHTLNSSQAFIRICMI